MPPSTSSRMTWRPNSTCAPPLWRGIARVCGSKRLSTFWSEETFLPSRTRLRVCAITRFTRGNTASASVKSRLASGAVCWLSTVTTRVACRTICSAVSMSFWYDCFGALHEAGKDPHAVHEQATVGRMMNVRLHTGRVQPQLAPVGYLRLLCQLHHPVIERV